MTAIGRRVLVVGCGVTGIAVARALQTRGHRVLVADDHPGRADAVADELGAGVEAVGAGGLGAAVTASGGFVPAPGLPEQHEAFELAAAAGVPTLSEFDLAAAWDARPLVSVTGTNGKTTVTTLVAEMLVRSGIEARAVGNTDVPLVAAIDRPDTEVFVVEASSFRLAHTRRFTPRVATWLNFAPDHLDVHLDLERYESAKARQWIDLDAGAVAVANLDDPTVMSHASRRGHATLQTFSILGAADHHLDGDLLRSGPGGFELPVSLMSRRLPHDISNALAAIASALPLGATADGIADALSSFDGLPHRMQLVGTTGGVDWYDDSKATTPHAVAAAVGGLRDVVLIAGGRNKGVDLSVLGGLSTVRAVVGIGESAAEVTAAFTDRPAEVADSMAAAVDAARALARPGDSVVLSPGCASFDWYDGYAARGDDFAAKVEALIRGSE